MLWLGRLVVLVLLLVVGGDGNGSSTVVESLRISFLPTIRKRRALNNVPNHPLPLDRPHRNQPPIGDRSCRLYESIHTEEEAGTIDVIHNNNNKIDDMNDNTPNDTTLSLLEETILQWFQGDFDNYQQVVQDHAMGLYPKQGGGHEHIHCTLVPLSSHSRLAAFYFDGNPQQIFRFRYYQLVPRPQQNAMDTILYTLHRPLEQQLRAASTTPTAWPSIFHSFTTTNTTNENVDQTVSSTATTIAQDDTTIENVIHNDPRIQLLPGCDVRWSFYLDPIQHSYAVEYNNDQEENNNNCNTNNHPLDASRQRNSERSSNDVQNVVEKGIHAVMVNGEALVDSQMIPGLKIVIKDQLSLWYHQLWIHDRGFHPTTGEYIYGNQREVPYQLQRVANFVGPEPNSSTTVQRTIVDDSLAWTMGSHYRTDDIYQDKMNTMGGPSINVPTRTSTTTSTTATTNGTIQK